MIYATNLTELEFTDSADFENLLIPRIYCNIYITILSIHIIIFGYDQL